jgi:hypothetical protein
MTAPATRTILDFALLQSADECYLDKVSNFSLNESVERFLMIGLNVPDKQNESSNASILASATSPHRLE